MGINFIVCKLITLAADEILPTLLSLPLETEIITETIHSVSQTIDSRHFAEEFMRRRKLADRGIIPDPPHSASPRHNTPTSASTAMDVKGGGFGGGGNTGSAGGNGNTSGGGGWSEVAKKGGSASAGGSAQKEEAGVNFKVVPNKKKGGKR
jgi:PERQ amino acid-rich with GYF domain-containing protein